MALDFLAGCLGGAAGVAVGHPFDTIKVKLQTQDAASPRYRGTWHCFTETLKQDSFKGLYRGMSSPMGGVAFVNAIIFGVHGNIMKKVKDPDALSSHLLAGSTAGFLQSFIASPMELSKTRMQIMSDSPGRAAKLYKNPVDCLKQMYKTEGVRGVFKGQTITILREVPGFGMYFVSYEWMLKKLCPDGNVNPAAILFAGGMAGTASWITCYPMDVIKSRIQADGMFEAAKYNGIRDCVKQSIRAEGLSVLTRGLSTTIIRAFPTNAATFAVVNMTMDLLQDEEEDTETPIFRHEFKTKGDEIIPWNISPLLLNGYTSQNLSDLNPNKNIIGSFFVPVVEMVSEDQNLYESSHESRIVSDLDAETRTNQTCDSNHLENDHTCEGVDCDSKSYRFDHLLTETSFCQKCGKCVKKGAQFIFNSSNSIKCLTLRQQTLSNAI